MRRRIHNFIPELRFIALAVICVASLSVVIFVLPGIHEQVYGKSNSSALMQSQNVILHSSLDSHIEHIVGKIHEINQYSNRTAHLIVINHVNNTGCYAECLSAYNYTISVLGNNPNPRTVKGSEAGTDVTLGEGNYNVTAPEVSTFYWRNLSPDCSGHVNASETKRCIITNSYANDIQTWTDEANNIKIQFSYLPLYPFVGNNTALNFKVTDLKTGLPLELGHVHIVIIKNATANFTSSESVSNKGDFITYNNVTSSHGIFFIRYQFEQEGMHQIIVRINTKNGGVALASFGVPVLFPE
jgi:hypothetical protein